MTGLELFLRQRNKLMTAMLFSLAAMLIGGVLIAIVDRSLTWLGFLSGVVGVAGLGGLIASAASCFTLNEPKKLVRYVWPRVTAVTDGTEYLFLWLGHELDYAARRDSVTLELPELIDNLAIVQLDSPHVTQVICHLRIVTAAEQIVAQAQEYFDLEIVTVEDLREKLAPLAHARAAEIIATGPNVELAPKSILGYDVEIKPLPERV